MEENWKDIEGYEGRYKVSNFGRVRSVDRILNSTAYVKGWTLRKGVVLRQNLDRQGYWHVKLCKNGCCKELTVHRLVAKAFIDNPNNYPCVNHLDFKPSNNNIQNLEWCTHDQNMKYSARHGRGKRERDMNLSRIKFILDIQTGVFYYGLQDAQKYTGIKQLYRYLNGTRVNKTKYIYA